MCLVGCIILETLLLIFLFLYLHVEAEWVLEVVCEFHFATALLLSWVVLIEEPNLRLLIIIFERHSVVVSHIEDAFVTLETKRVPTALFLVSLPIGYSGRQSREAKWGTRSPC